MHKMFTSQILALFGSSHCCVIWLKCTSLGPSQAQPDFESQLEAFPETSPYLKEISKSLCYTAQFICAIVLITISNYLEYWLLCFFTVFLLAVVDHEISAGKDFNLSCSQPLSSASRTLYLLKEHKILPCYGEHQGPILSLLCSFCPSTSALLLVPDSVAWEIEIWHCVKWASSHSDFYLRLDNRGPRMKLKRR